jgi:hypothetical protein
MTETLPEKQADIVERLNQYAEDWRDRASTAVVVRDAAAEIVGLREALREIKDLRERPFLDFPEDWRSQIEGCLECQRYSDHPIQQGICDQHRKPLYAQRDHEKHETSILGYRMRTIASDALATHEGI